jgi:aryl-alcohol dehydrogenase-like predicted oxidoreductase
MEYIRIGSTLSVSRIGLGTWAIGGWMWGGTDEARSITTIRTAIERGVTLIDTAPVYGFGRSEEILGKAIAAHGVRDRVCLASKVGLAWKDGSPYRDASPAHIRREIEDSLRRLHTEVIDLCQVHWPDPDTPLEETARALEQLRAQGKIRLIGLSNCDPQQMAVFGAIAPLASVQSPYNLFERQIEDDVLPYATRTGLTVLSYGALCRGLLSGAMTSERTFAGDDLRNVDPKFRGTRLRQYLDVVEQLDALARERFGKSVLALALRWVLDRGPTIALWGARRPGQLDPIGEVEGWRLDADTMAEIDAILARSAPPPLAPDFMAPPVRSAAVREARDVA